VAEVDRIVESKEAVEVFLHRPEKAAG